MKDFFTSGRWRKPALTAYAAVCIAAEAVLLTRRSSEPFLFGRYSLPYFIFLAAIGVLLTSGGFFLARTTRLQFFLIFRNLCLLAILLLGIELAGRADGFFHPNDQVLYLKPDRILGWRSVPEFRWFSAGPSAADYQTWITTNKKGFHDRDHTLLKQAGTVRVAVLGESFVEAVQMPLEQTAVRLLEQKMNTLPTENRYKAKWEVINGGVSNYGVGQYYLLWQHEMKDYQPDVVFLLLHGIPMNNTVSRYETSAFSDTGRKELWIRPVFEIEESRLVFKPARDYEDFEALQQHLIEKNGGGRTFRIRKGSFLSAYLNDLWHELDRNGIKKLNRLQRNLMKNQDEEVQSWKIDVNLRLLEQMNRELKADHTRLVLVDISRYLEPQSRLPEVLSRFAKEHGCGYIPLYQPLLAAQGMGRGVHWPGDRHLNALGNQIFSDAMEDWLRRE